MKVVINQRYGGFSVSQELLLEMNSIDTAANVSEEWLRNNRHDPLFAETVLKLGDEANGEYSNLVVVEWPSLLPYKIEEYDGWETIDLDVEGFLAQHAEEIEKAHTPLSHDLHHYRNFLNNKEG